MRESRSYGSVRGALSNERPYREPAERYFSVEPISNIVRMFDALAHIIHDGRIFRRRM